MQDFLFSTEAVTLAARKGLILKFKSVARRRLVRAGVSREEMQQRLHEEMQKLADVTDHEEFATDFNASFQSVATSRLNQTARSLYYHQEEESVTHSASNMTSRSVFHEEVMEDEVEIVIDSSPPRMALPATPEVAGSHPPPTYSPLQSSSAPLAASSSQQMLSTISVVSPSFLGYASTPVNDEGNLFDAYNNNSFMDTAPINPGDGFSVCSQLDARLKQLK